MKILWISHILPYPPRGGVTQRSYHLIREVAEENEVFLFALNQKAWLPTEEGVARARTEFQRFCTLVEIFDIPSDGSKWERYNLAMTSLLSKNSYTANWTYSKEMHRRIRAFIADQKIDAIHCDTIGLGEYVKDIRGIPMALNHHNVESHMMLRRAEKETNFFKKIYFFIEGKKLRNYEKKICPLFNKNLVVSELDKIRFSSFIPHVYVDTIPNGVDANFFTARNCKVERHNLVFAARLNAYPNEDAVVWFLKEMWPLLKKRVPDISLTIAGRNPTARIKKEVGLDPAIRMTGYVDDIRPFIEKAEVYICPIRDGGGTKLKLLDAMAMGKAIVTTAVGAEGLNLEDGEHALFANDPGAFISCIIKIFENRDLRIQLGNKSRDLVAKSYTWEIIGKKLNETYRKMCSEKQPKKSYVAAINRKDITPTQAII